MAEWQHKTVTIALGDDGKFTATVGGKRLRFTSLDAAKKAIDKVEAEAFVARPALMLDYRRNAFSEITVLGSKAPRKGSWRNTLEWVYRNAKGDEHTISNVAFDTPENRAAMEAVVALHIKNDEIRSRLKAEEEEAEEKIVYTKPDAA